VDQPTAALLADLKERGMLEDTLVVWGDRKSTRLNSSHRCISYAVFCLKTTCKGISAGTPRPSPLVGGRSRFVNAPSGPVLRLTPRASATSPMFFFLRVGRPRHIPSFPAHYPSLN